MECINFQVALKAICEMFRASVLKEGVSAKQVAIIYSPAPKSNLNKKGFELGLILKIAHTTTIPTMLVILPYRCYIKTIWYSIKYHQKAHKSVFSCNLPVR